MRFRLFTLMLFFLLLLVRCTNPIEANRRIALDILVIDQNQNGIEGIEVNAGMYSDGILQEEQFVGLTGVGETNEAGNARIISLKPIRTGTDVLALLVNTENPNLGGIAETYGTTTIRLDILEDFEIIFPNIVLGQKANVTVNIINASGTSDEFIYTLDVVQSNQIFSFPEQDINDPSSFAKISGSRNLILSEGESDTSLTLPTLQGSVGFFTYFFRNASGETEPVTTEVLINEANFLYEFNY